MSGDNHSLSFLPTGICLQGRPLALVDGIHPPTTSLYNFVSFIPPQTEFDNKWIKILVVRLLVVAQLLVILTQSVYSNDGAQFR